MSGKNILRISADFARCGNCEESVEIRVWTASQGADIWCPECGAREEIR